MTAKLKAISILFAFTAICVFVAAGTGIAQTVFKGMELYSWRPAAGIWHFSLLMGTNRTKTIEEITDHAVTIVGVEELKKRLSQLPGGENVFWLNYAKEPVPKKLVKDLTEYCKSHGINLHVDNI
jgi:hypothetical protein